MSSLEASTWSATELMALSLTGEKANPAPNTITRIPSAAQRYYAQSRKGPISNGSITSATPADHTSVSRISQKEYVKEEPTSDDGRSLENDSKGEGISEKRSRKRKQPTSVSTPRRCSPRLVIQRTAALEKMLRERLSGKSPPAIKYRRNSRQLRVEIASDALPALSEDPASYNSDEADCRFHLPVTVEDRLAIRAAMTPTLFRLQKKGWGRDLVWNSDASYMEAHQKCLQEYYKFESEKEPGMSPFALPAVLTLLPWYGKIGDFRNSPNWPKGW